MNDRDRPLASDWKGEMRLRSVVTMCTSNGEMSSLQHPRFALRRPNATAPQARLELHSIEPPSRNRLSCRWKEEPHARHTFPLLPQWLPAQRRMANEGDKPKNSLPSSCLDAGYPAWQIAWDLPCGSRIGNKVTSDGGGATTVRMRERRTGPPRRLGVLSERHVRCCW